MCTFQGEAAVVVCDIAIEQVRDELTAEFGSAVQFTHMEGKGTLVEAGAALNPARFAARARAAIASAQTGPQDGPAHAG
jgi:hypothetical protein